MPSLVRGRTTWHWRGQSVQGCVVFMKITSILLYTKKRTTANAIVLFYYQT